MILFKELVAADTKYNFSNQVNCVVFDVHNDTPYNLGISFGRDSGVNNADYYTSPHSILTGITAVGNAPSIGHNTWNGTVYLYTETPLGTGVTNLACSPAFQLTVIGYPVGFQPSGSTSMSRMMATANEVSTNVTSTNSVVNDGNPAGTQFIESTPSDAATTTISMKNDGTVTVKSDIAGVLKALLTTIPSAASGAVSVQLGDATRLIEVLGTLQADINILLAGGGVIEWFNGASFQSSVTGNNTGGLIYNASGSLHSFLISGNAQVAHIDSNGIHIDSGSVSYLTGSLSRVSAFNGTGSGTYNHNCGATPLWIGPIVHQSGSATQGYDSENATQVHVTLGSSLAFQAFCIKA